MNRQIVISAVVLILATILLYPRVGNALWVWLAIATVIWVIGFAIVRVRR
ncbi:MAG TPA: hypothetical protein VHK65_18220 [Candidatus Dormibacteraeota bacterium]|nr:hypothetical protein [Candidatus Dormibacteraeota bacterium]